MLGLQRGLSYTGMDRMLCTQCGALAYSAAARKLVEDGQRCLRCGGALVLEDDRTREPEPAEKPSGN